MIIVSGFIEIVESAILYIIICQHNVMKILTLFHFSFGCCFFFFALWLSSYTYMNMYECLEVFVHRLSSVRQSSERE